MADTTEDNPELAPNMWFAEYGMPYTTAILEGEAASNREDPELRGEERHPVSQFLIDQETAVVRDFIDGKISQEEFDAFKELSAQKLESLQDRIEIEADELSEDFEDWEEDLGVEVQAFAKEHGTEISNIVDVAKARELSADDLSLHMASDLLGLGVNALDGALEKLPPHIHDIIDVVESESLDAAHAMLDARGELSSADEHNLAGQRERLEEIEPAFEAEVDEIHEAIDDGFGRVDKDLEKVQDSIATAQEHGERDPGTTIEHFPYKTIEDQQLNEEVEDASGVTDA
ncbi:MAG: hypothetical protein AB8B93_00025 [Pseudomonadales bacterium]